MAEQEVDPSSSPLARFGAELRRSRRARGWSQTDLAQRMGYSNTLISYVERGQRKSTKHFAVKADSVFDTGQTYYELWRRIDGASLLEGFPEFMDAEARCKRLRIFYPTIVPGIFQLPEYSMAFFSAAVLRGAITQTEADERLEIMASRQQLLDRRKPPAIHAILDESCLVRIMGGAQVMAKQLARLEELAARPSITIQVSPFSVGEHLPFSFPVMLLDMPDRSILGYAESYARGHLERNQRTVAAWDSEYDQLQMEALPKAASLEFFRKAREELS
ncbi:Scr1 family TA system antitoxin-like transcriptional regulator [Kitasatospora sp. NPDC058965]|uniref:helix-turn-helix domain-containing protein n=1 Tax=Kitasatospora sp. NPDC058965 TaxID=3346682 RepID=UPI003675C11F